MPLKLTLHIFLYIFLPVFYLSAWSTWPHEIAHPVLVFVLRFGGVLEFFLRRWGEERVLGWMREVVVWVDETFRAAGREHRMGRAGRRMR